MRHKAGWQQITDEMMKLREQGYTNKEIGEKLHYCRNTVSSRIGRQPKDLILKKMLALRDQGMSNKEIAIAVGRHQRTVYRTIGRNPNKVRRGYPPRFESDEMLSLRGLGLSNMEIAKAIGCDTSTVNRHIGCVHHRYGPDFDEAVRALRVQGWGCERIGKQLGVPSETVRKHVKKMNM